MKMKTTVLGVIAGLGLMAGSGASALGSSLVLTWPSGYGDFPDGGGEFTAVTSDATLALKYDSKATRMEGNALGFQTFCIEYTEEFYPGWTYTYEISPFAKNGGATLGPDGTDLGNGNKIDPVSVGTAYLYSQFATGVLTDYNYNPSSGPGSREESARSLQNLIWYLEGERPAPLSDTLTAGWLTELNNHFGAFAMNATADDLMLHQNGVTAANYGVAALNTGPNIETAYNVQDQLIYQGRPGAAHPLPDGGWSLSMLGMATIGLLVFQRRIRKVS